MSEIEEKNPETATPPSTLKIKNMVCDRCIMVVDEVLRGQGLRVAHVVIIL